ncbi:hypothetical protein ACFLWS_04320 [Chloroflexota bacterium]
MGILVIIMGIHQPGRDSQALAEKSSRELEDGTNLHDGTRGHPEERVILIDRAGIYSFFVHAISLFRENIHTGVA